MRDSSSTNCYLDGSYLARPFFQWVTVRRTSNSTLGKAKSSLSERCRRRERNPRVFTGKWATCCRRRLIWEQANAHRIRPVGGVTVIPEEGDSAFTVSFVFSFLAQVLMISRFIWTFGVDSVFCDKRPCHRFCFANTGTHLTRTSVQIDVTKSLFCSNMWHANTPASVQMETCTATKTHFN